MLEVTSCGRSDPSPLPAAAPAAHHGGKMADALNPTDTTTENSSTTLSSVAELIDFEESLEQRPWAFRGQPRDFGTLVPSFWRQFSRHSVGAAQLIERRLIDTFREHYAKLAGQTGNARSVDQSSSMPSADRVGPGYDLRCLSVMQHYEIPTRLLDSTSSFWTAVYFACSSDPGSAAELWYYDRLIFATQRYLQVELATLVDATPQPPPEPDFLSWRGRELLIELDVQITPRMTHQKAHHTVSANVFADHAPLFALLPKQDKSESANGCEASSKPILSRLLIDASCKGKALQFLAEHKTTTASTLFPDVVGLGRFLRWQFESLRTMML